MILVVGDVVDDIGVRPLGRINAASDTESEIRMTSGGSAANVAAWLGHLGAPVRFIGRVGADAIDRHVAALPGVDARLTGDTEQITATIVLTLDEAANRTMYVDRGANSTLTSDHLPDDRWDQVTWLHLTGYTFFDAATRPVAEQLMAEARELGVGISIDPSSLGFLQAAGADRAETWFEPADLLFPNEDEMALLGSDDRSVVTQGADGAEFRGSSVRPVPGHVLDTTGAGDAFCAGFLSVWVVEHDVDDALEAGARAAALCVSVRGGRP